MSAGDSAADASVSVTTRAGFVALFKINDLFIPKGGRHCALRTLEGRATAACHSGSWDTLQAEPPPRDRRAASSPRVSRSRELRVLDPERELVRAHVEADAGPSPLGGGGGGRRRNCRVAGSGKADAACGRPGRTHLATDATSGVPCVC